MKILPAASSLTVFFLLGACAGSPVNPVPVRQMAQDIPVSTVSNQSRETLLLVSLDDGSVIMQTISSNADVCFKNNSDSATTCLIQGAPVFDPLTSAVIGFEMIEEHIDLVAKSD